MQALRRFRARDTSAKQAEKENNGIFAQFINESQVISDQLTAAVEEVNQTIGQLTDIADCSAMTESGLRECSGRAMESIGETFSTLQEVAASAEQIERYGQAAGCGEQGNEGNRARRVRSLTNTDKVMNDLQRHNGTMDAASRPDRTDVED